MVMTVEKRRMGRPRGATDSARAGRPHRSVATFEGRHYAIRTGEQIRAVREENGISQSRLAAACGVNPRTVSIWETKGYKLSVWRLWQIATAIGVPVSHLLGEGS